MRVLIDRNGLQASLHLGTHPSQKPGSGGHRLRTLIAELEAAGCSARFSASDAISRADLDATHLLIITTRMPRLPRPSNSELADISGFVESGGALLLMANHPFPEFENQIPDRPVAELFDISLTGPCFKASGSKISGSDLEHHPHFSGLGEGIEFNNSCRIEPGSHATVATLPGEQSCFAVAAIRQGRVLATADSGFITDADPGWSGPGLISHAGNRNFLRRSISWLLPALATGAS